MATMNDPHSYKTLFLLDCSNNFRSGHCGQIYEIDVLNKSRQTSGITPLAPISKTLYTCAVEAIFEYCRIVWDLFPCGERLIRISCCMSDGVKVINSLDVAQQNYENLLDSFYKFSVLTKLSSIDYNKDSSPVNCLINGFVDALNCLSTPNADSGNFCSNVTNSARIILITNFSKEADVNYFKDEIKKIFDYHNLSNKEKQKISPDFCGMINNLEVVLLNTIPVDEQPKTYFSNVPKHNLTDNLIFSVYSIFSGSILAKKLTYFAFEHHDLASTTVSGIPMKEEQNAGTSANYDVEIVHSKKAHTKFFNSAEFPMDYNLLFINSDDKDYKTLYLKWCTPKNSSVEFNHCIGAHRITAVDVNSRPSSCLINFLHTGKTVNLEMQRIRSNKILSHMLQAHNGELFIHVLSCTRSLIEDPPSISEGVGGRITDYRINEFADFMRKHRLFKMSNDTNNLEKAQALLKKFTLYWPISYGFTVFFNIREQMQTFYNLISKEKLTDHEVIELKNIIYNLVASESKGLNLPIQSNIIRSKGLKKDDLYRILWSEMEHIIRCFNETSQHLSVLQCLQDCKPKNDANTSMLNCLNINVTNQVKNGSVNGDAANSTNHKHGAKINLNNIAIGNETLQNLYLNKVSQKNLKRRREFYGRTNNEGKIAKLYTELVEEK